MRTGKLLIILLILSNQLSAQDITGLWKGVMYNDTTQLEYRYEIAISQEKGKLTGYSHTWFIMDDKQYFGVKTVKIRKQGGKIIVEDAQLIADNYPIAPAKGVRQLNILDLEIKDSMMFLTGPFTTNNTKLYHAITGTIHLQRKNDFWQSALVPHLQELKLANSLSFVQEQQATQAATAAARIEKENQEAAFATVQVTTAGSKIQKPTSENSSPRQPLLLKGDKKLVAVDTTETQVTEVAIAIVPKPKQPETSVISKQPVVPVIAPPAQQVYTRTMDLQQTVYFKSDSLELSLFDNGVVDGDTVSVLMNGKIIFAKERMSTVAVRKTVSIDPSQDSILLVMYAENLGTIPPNTGLLVVKDGKEIYEIRFSGDLKKNAAILFKRRK